MTQEEKDLCFQLRTKTGLGLMSCKKCLQDNDWNLNKAFKNSLKYQWDGRLIHVSND